ncbi:AAA family ATPase [Aquimarina litoralis]|uniref:AAA family ATPase n=1 Tax=Aquimarina litoralis TaxID=584605 RepID=UPI001C59056C|nr:AAA family ATPase [Aquimarina litoralis]MBW1294968.1 AAA family ATPase [Aquimarina litoralis]
MNIESIEIYNYKSIESLKVPITRISDKKCQIFLGKNESGKSNILKAISLLNEDAYFDYQTDCNKKAKKKDESVTITLNLKFENFGHYRKQFDNFGIPKALQSKIIPYQIQRHTEINSKNDRKDYLHIWINDDKEFSKYVYNSSDFSFHLISDKYKEKEPLTKDNIKSILGSTYILLTKSKIESHLEKKMLDNVTHNTPMPIIWRPSSEFLINKPIDLDDFSTKPTISLPLRNIFNISGIIDIKKRIDLIKDDIEERAQLKQELSSSITNYINERWPEHKINIFIEIENMMCSVMVEDKDDTLPKYKMEQRSEGFQQFISILLNLSIESNTEKIKNKIILLDEPEIHLHPSGVKYLREELLKIALSNIVFVASHSIYMVDKLNLDRHFKVSKEMSLTSIKQIKKDNPYEEEVIYEALGTSVYEHIQPNMLIFEGKTDKDLFDGFLKKYKRDIKPVRIGTISADGVEKIPTYVKFMEGKLVKGFIVVDSDSAGVKIKERVKNESKSFNTKNTFEINDIYKTNKASTLEDLYPIHYIISEVSKNYKVEIELDSKSPIIKQIETKNKNLQGKINVKELKGILVNGILNDINKLSKEDAKNKYNIYYNFVFNLNEKLKK